MDRKTKEKIISDFKSYWEDSRSSIQAILLFGSYTTGEETKRSDIDICIVPDWNPEMSQQVDISLSTEIIRKAWRFVGGKYDLWLFTELPIYLQSEVIDNHKIIFCNDLPKLYEFFYHFRKLKEDYTYRLRVANGEF